MTQQQKSTIQNMLLSLSNVVTIQQVDAIWPALSSLCRQAGFTLPNKPTSVPQAKSVANSLRSRVSGTRIS